MKNKEILGHSRAVSEALSLSRARVATYASGASSRFAFGDDEALLDEVERAHVGLLKVGCLCGFFILVKFGDGACIARHLNAIVEAGVVLFFEIFKRDATDGGVRVSSLVGLVGNEGSNVLLELR